MTDQNSRTTSINANLVSTHWKIEQHSARLSASNRTWSWSCFFWDNMSRTEGSYSKVDIKFLGYSKVPCSSSPNQAVKTRINRCRSQLLVVSKGRSFESNPPRQPQASLSYPSSTGLQYRPTAAHPCQDISASDCGSQPLCKVQKVDDGLKFLLSRHTRNFDKHSCQFPCFGGGCHMPSLDWAFNLCGSSPLWEMKSWWGSSLPQHPASVC